ncbi:hypothetical protein BN159_5933 [Streptomyces davaonensis JCM 4913]|uniref:DUF397 domain-containing protein n=1 Tax=Streptomyces davaonensis (strain DSM 101723 / JCM 4913 / KCC S-0913 / 768) TaxID=1214101 RepID=K4RAT0_STRDJ|nr:DUF397 domain-containing protein [Streptomyces davaonensis]CCK30312.1 hypothetical protein BN159_5933 [Streptomyces davaonensis JCM 4913]
MSTSELKWFKSSYSSSGSGDCIEVAVTAATVHVRDSKDRRGAQLALSPTAWADFIAGQAPGHSFHAM